MDKKTKKIAIISLLTAAAGTALYFGTRKKSTDEKRDDIKSRINETPGANNPENVDNMSEDEVNTVHDAIGPDAGSGGGGGGGSSSGSSSVSTSDTIPKNNVAPPSSIISIHPLLVPLVNNVTVTRGNSLPPAPVIRKPIIPKNIAVKYPVQRSVVIKRGMGSVDVSHAAAILKRHGIIN